MLALSGEASDNLIVVKAASFSVRRDVLVEYVGLPLDLSGESLRVFTDLLPVE